ncbi:putative UDP-glucuronosyltransferase 2A3 [Hymenopellis radicata]|nr:putative UDP-glucuronosyltransferase 2A3 [Hymenopellis radicata]
MAQISKPFVLLTSMPAMGHYAPMRAIANGLIQRGYEVTILTGPRYRESAEEMGATFVALGGHLNDLDFNHPKLLPKPGPEMFAEVVTEVFVKALPDQHEGMQHILRSLRDKDPSRPIVLVNECSFLGPLATTFGAPGLRPDATIVVGILPMMLSSEDLAPFGPGLSPPTTPEEWESYTDLRAHWNEVATALPRNEFHRILGTLGGTKETQHNVFDALIFNVDRFLQMCVPSLEYPRSDAPDSIRFAGGLPRGHRYRGKEVQIPEWWKTIITNPERKRIVAVAQGTVQLDYTQLVVPTLTAFADVGDVITIAVLGKHGASTVKHGASLPSDFVVPNNAYVGDYIPYDDLLEHIDVFVTNGGYGGFQHSMSHGVPIVIGGTTEDKPEVAARAEWAGVGVNLKTDRPSPEQVRTAVREVLEHPKYKARALEIEKEMQTYDPIQIIADSVEELAKAVKIVDSFIHRT